MCSHSGILSTRIGERENGKTITVDAQSHVSEAVAIKRDRFYAVGSNAGRLGVVVAAQFQPYAGADGMLSAGAHSVRNRAVPMRELLDEGLIVSGGSDWPGAPNIPS